MTVPTRRGRSGNGPDDDRTTSASAKPETKPGTKPEAKRINVVVTPEVVRSLELVMENEQVTLTEAVRRLVGYGDFVYRAIKEDNSEVLVRKDDSVREIVLL